MIHEHLKNVKREFYFFRLSSLTYDVQGVSIPHNGANAFVENFRVRKCENDTVGLTPAKLRAYNQLVFVLSLPQLFTVLAVSARSFEQSARVQELINAATLSHREGRWVHLPL